MSTATYLLPGCTTEKLTTIAHGLVKRGTGIDQVGTVHNGDGMYIKPVFVPALAPVDQDRVVVDLLAPFIIAPERVPDFF